jgi:hypothetical protein
MKKPMKRSRLLRRLLVIGFAFGVAFLFWRLSPMPNSRQKCEPSRVEEKDASGKIVKITERKCL